MKSMLLGLLVLMSLVRTEAATVTASLSSSSSPNCKCSAPQPASSPIAHDAEKRPSAFRLPESKQIFNSAEFWAALFGALAAFLLEAMRRWIQDRKHKIAAGNEAVFAMAQMHSLATLINNQMFEDRKVQVRKVMEREPLYFEFLPMPLPPDIWSKMGLDRLGFILATYNPNLMSKLAGFERGFSALMHFVERRNAQHEEFQQRRVALPHPDAPVQQAHLEKMIGIDLCAQLRQSTEELMKGLPKAAADAVELGKQLSATLSFVFPLARISRFTPTDRQRSISAGPDPVAPLWRRLVRGFVTKVRRPTGVVLDEKQAG
jgi:hypothetical protein